MEELTKKRATLTSGVNVPNKMQLPERHAKAAAEVDRLANAIAANKRRGKGW